MKKTKTWRGAFGLVAMLVAGSASAQATFTLSLNSSGQQSNGTNPVGCAQLLAGCTNNSVNGKFSAYATSTSDSASLLQIATITDQNGSGIGINSGSESAPDHAIDSNGKDELILINFGSQKVSLTGVTSGWSQQDTDVSLLRWTGSAAPDLTTMSMTGGSTGLLAKGWQLVASSDMDNSNNTNYSTTFGNTSMTLLNSSTASSWWIVSAYFGSNSGNLDAGNDYFKLLKVSGCLGIYTNGKCTTDGGSNNNPVPVPGTLALAGLGLAAFAWRRRAVAR